MIKERVHWVDSLRGLAILFMVIFHIAFNIDLLGIHPISLYSGFWLFLARFVQFTFLILVGFSLHLSFIKNIKKRTYAEFLKHQLWRSAKLFAVAMAITAVSYVIYPQGYIRFGVLHLISVGIIIGALLIKYRKTLIAVIFLSLMLGAVFSKTSFANPLLLPFGVIPKGFYTLDYFPIFPWIALIFFGMTAGRFFAVNSWLTNPPWFKRFILLEKMGQKSLFIYLIHQPVLLGVMWLVIKL